MGAALCVGALDVLSLACTEWHLTDAEVWGGGCRKAHPLYFGSSLRLSPSKGLLPGASPHGSRIQIIPLISFLTKSGYWLPSQHRHTTPGGLGAEVSGKDKMLLCRSETL